MQGIPNSISTLSQYSTVNQSLGTMSINNQKIAPTDLSIKQQCGSCHHMPNYNANPRTV